MTDIAIITLKRCVNKEAKVAGMVKIAMTRIVPMICINKTIEMGIEIYVCEASKQMLGLEKVELIPGVKIVGAGTLNDLALESGATMWF